MQRVDKHRGGDKPSRREPGERPQRPARELEDALDDDTLERYGRAAFCTELRQGSRRRG